MHSRFDAAFARLPDSLQLAMESILADDYFSAMLTAAEVEGLKHQTGFSEDELAVALLPLAAACARTGISHFNVGAITRGVSGNLYFGSNMEFSGSTMQQTVHAEQSAITHAWMRGETGIVSITVNYTPCGHCRQFMNELNSGLALRINLPDRQPSTLGDYLPDAFGPRDLKIRTLLLDKEDHGFELQGDELTRAAIAAANRSHVPYSNAPAGVALETRDGKIFSGSYAENAAFNPSLPPLQTALNMLSLSGYSHGDIQRVMLAELACASLSQWDTTVAILKTFDVQGVDRTLLG